MIFAKRAKINFPILLRMIGWLLIIEAIFMLFPLGASLFYQDSSIQGLFFTVIITLSTGLILTFGIKPKNKDMGKREALLLTSMVWIIFSLFGMLPFIICEPHLDISRAFFEAVSGFTTTGATVIKDVESVPNGVLLWRSLMQWIGGMGIILFTLAIMPMLNHQGGIQLFNAEVSGITHDKLRPRISQTAKGLWFVYIILTILEIVLLVAGPMSLFDSICHTLSTVSTGGFSTKNASVGAWNSWYIDIVIIVFMFLGSVNFALLYKAGTGKFKPLYKNNTFRWYVGIILSSSIVIALLLFYGDFYDVWQEYALYPLFQIVSAITSTGFGVTNFELWGQFALSLIFLIMFFGGCAGSTTGGAKIDRMILLIKNTKNEFYKILHPNSITTVRVNEKIVPFEVVSKVIAFLALYVMILAVSSILLTLCGLNIFDSFFAAISCLSNIGYGAGYTGVDGSYANIDSIGLYVLSFTMVTGRLELFTFLIIFTKDFWTK